MPNNDKDKIKNKKPSSFNEKAYRHAISMIESSGGKFLETGINPKTGKHYSSAAGKYHFLYESIMNDPDMNGVTKREFINDDSLQEKIMDKALAGTLKGYTYGSGYAEKLKSDYNSDYDVNQLTAMIHFLGAGNARKFLKDPQNFKVPGAVNLTGDQYMKKFKGYFDSYNANNSEEAKPGKAKPVLVEDERLEGVKVQDGTSVASPITKSRGNQPIPNSFPTKAPQQDMMKDLLSKLPQDIKNYEERSKELNNFKQGGHITGQSGAEELVTLFETGGSHEQNPIGGIPQGMGANGKPNLVEEGETKWNDYIFSNAISLDGNYTGDDGKTSNVFENGGELNPPTKNPVSNIEPDLPRTFPKSEMKTNAYGGSEKVTEHFELPDVRKQHMPNDNYVSANPNEDVDFQSQVKGEGSQKFLDRYNDPITREMMKDQTNLSDQDIDNMILKGLSADKVIGGNTGGSKGSYDPEKNKIHMGEEHKDDTGAEVHETVHASLFDSAQGQNLMNVLGNPFKQEGRESMKKSQMGRDILGYMKKPHEAYGNFSEFREKIGLKPGEKITEEELKKRAKDKGLTNENFYRSFNNKNITKALNTIAYQDNNDINDYKLA